MATVQQKRPKAQRLAERDPQVYHPLDRLRGIIRRYVVIEGVLSAFLFVALWFTLGLMFDYGIFKVTGWDWVQDGSWWLRTTALLVALSLFVALLIFRIVTRLTKEFSYASLALVLERRFPKVLGDRLITAVEMADVEKMGKYGYSKDMLRVTIAEARERVAKVPVNEVFNWKRLWLMGFLAVGLFLATLAFSYGAFVVGAKSSSPVRFGWKFAHVTGIFLERNVALMDTPWPRRAHLELVGFPPDEMTIGRDAPPPRITARAYRWVIADDSAPAGWRPLRWDDLNTEFVGRSVPKLCPTIEKATALEGTPTVDTVERMAYDSGGEATPESLKTREQIRQEMNNREEADPTSSSGKKIVVTQDYEELQEVIKALIAKADKPSMGRTLRRLDVPETVIYRYSGQRTAGNGDLAPQQNNEFAGEIGGLKEDVDFIVKAADFATIPRKIRLIPPPSLRRIGREQAEPAYLHHAPPVGEGYNALKGKLQNVVAKDLSLTGERTIFAVPAGSELTLTAEVYSADDGTVSDNDRVVSAVAIPVSGRFPGTVFDKDGKPTQTPVPLKLLDNGEKFVIEFKNQPRDPEKPNELMDFRLTDKVEFKVTFTNKYNISATRTFIIQVTQDQPPVVEVAVDVIRRSGNFYLVTPNARIPFNPDSFIKDDHGLSNLTYSFTYRGEDSDVVRAIRAKLAMRSLLDVPLPGTGQMRALPLAYADNFRLVDKGDNSIPGSVFVSEYLNQASLLRRDTRAEFERLIGTAKTEGAPSQAVRKVELKEPERDYFDLKVLNDENKIKIRALPGEVQPIYRMDLFVQATDNNVDRAGGPNVVTNAEPIRLKIISEGDLLREIGNEERQLASRLTEAISRVQAAKRKYEFVRNTNGYKEEIPENVDSVKVRAQDALGDVDKARDIVQTVVREFTRLKRECEVNRLNQAALDGYTKRTARVAGILSEDPNVRVSFPKTLGLMNQVQNPLNSGRWAPLAFVTDAETALYRLEAELTEIRNEIDKAGDIETLKKELIAIKEQQERIRKEVEDWKRQEDEIKLSPHPTYSTVGVVSLAKGETKKVEQKIQWNQYKLDDIVVKVTVLDAANNPVTDALTVPSELKLNFEQHQFRFDYEVKAGNKDGMFKVRLTPALGPPVEFSVIVK